jgi:predicted DNA-binding transcriptional regulator AlpA
MSTNAPIKPRFLTHAQVCQLVGITQSGLDDWVEIGKFPAPIRPGGVKGKRLYPVAAVEAFLAKLEKEAGHV